MTTTTKLVSGTEKSFSVKFYRNLLFISILFVSPARDVSSLACPEGQLTFELVTGFVYTAPDDTLELVPGTLHLTDCLSYCRSNASCESVNYETGLCVLFSSSTRDRPSALHPSQFPVFTIYANKICLSRKHSCDREWLFERVIGYELLDRARKKATATTLELCMELCLDEIDFECRSANYHYQNGDCFLSDVDRQSVAPQKYFLSSESKTAYLENNCVDQAVRLCEFRKFGGKILKTVDAVFQGVTSLEECRKKCLNVNYRCQSFDMGDPTNSVCRLSHLSSSSLTHINEPYLDIPGASTFEISSCYNVTIQCRSREMVAFVKTTKLFNGKVYVKSRPNSCVTDVINSLEFEIRMAYHDLNCDVKQQDNSQFANDIVIQHHDMIVTNQDLGVSLHCQYDLTNKSISHGVRLEVNGDVDAHGTRTESVASPNVTMKITDRLGHDLYTAQVGDPLALRFEISDTRSPYEIFVRELIAMDGIDDSEILLIDALGCPTDTLIMGAMTKMSDDGKVLHAIFDAFKFPTSEIVQFKALVTPCLPTCEPVECSVRSFAGNPQKLASLGKRRRRSTRNDLSLRKGRSTEEEELVVVQTIHVTDKFGFDETEKINRNNDEIESSDNDGVNKRSSSCLNVAGLVISFSLFLIAQLVILLTWAFLWHRRNRSRGKLRSENSRSIDMIYSQRRESSYGEAYSVQNSYRSDIIPYDTVYNHTRNMTSHY